MAVTPPLGVPVLLDILQMILAVSFQVFGILIEPRLDARIIVSGVMGIVLTPAGIIVPLEGPLTFRVATGLLAVAQLPVR